MIVALSIPFSILAACGVWYFLGRSLNILSMMGLILAVGMLVDNAIVVLESIDRRMHSAPSRKVAALEGAKQVLMAVTASTTTTLIVFLPIVVGSGNELTTWLGEVGMTISIALLCSLFSSLTLIPLMSAHMLKRRDNGRNRQVEWIEERYVRVLGWTLRHKLATFVLLVVGLGIGLAPFFAGWVDSAMFSATLNRRLYMEYEFRRLPLQVGCRAGGHTSGGAYPGARRRAHDRLRVLVLRGKPGGYHIHSDARRPQR